MGPLTLAIVAGGVAAGFIQGLSGFAYALVATAIWVWLVEPQMLVPLVLCSSLIGQVASSHAIGSHFKLARAAPFLIGGAVGVPIGVATFHQINEDAFRFGVGLILILYCTATFAVANLPKITRGGKWADGIVGLVSGVMGGLGGLSGPAPIIWCALRGWDKNVQRATFQPLFFLVGVLTTAMYGATGGITAETLHALALVAPAVMVSSWLGARVYKAVPEQAFRKLLLVMLLISGLTLVGPPAFRWMGM